MMKTLTHNQIQTCEHQIIWFSLDFHLKKKFKRSILQAMETIWELLFTCHPRPTVIQKMIPLPPRHTRQWQGAHTPTLLITGWEDGNSTEIGTEESDLEQLLRNQLCLMCPEKANIPGTCFCSPKHCRGCVFHFQRRYSGLGLVATWSTERSSRSLLRNAFLEDDLS